MWFEGIQYLYMGLGVGAVLIGLGVASWLINQ
jgi:hypothetical protein